MYDLVTLGETMIRFSPAGFLRLEQADTLQLHVGGSESNTAVGLSRLGNKVCWLSRLTDNPLGRNVANQIHMYGVDTSHVIWTEQDRVGTYYLEQGSPPRGSRVIYDRANSAYSKYSKDMLPVDLFKPGTSKWLHVTGISLGLGETSQQLIRHAVQLARNAGWQISFDVNYRALLWNADEAKRNCDELFESADLVFVAIRDLELLWNVKEASPERTAGVVHEMRNGKTTVVSMSSDGAFAVRDCTTVVQKVSPVPVIGRLGGGDSFSAGFLHSWISNEDDLSLALRWGTTVAALKYSIPGDLPLIELKEAERLVASKDAVGILQR